MDLVEVATQWIREQIVSARAEGALVGLSGGLDSAVVAALIKRAFPNNSLGVIMPIRSTASDINDAKIVADTLGLKTVTIALDGVFEAFISVLPEGTEIAVANLKPRIRMTALYYLANSLNYLVVGTGNKSELSVGYFTKYGDGGVDILPLADVYKTDLPRIARSLSIPERIIRKPPSAGLWEGQTDEGEMGVTYRELDTLLKAREKGYIVDLPDEVVERITRMIERSAHKRAPAAMLLMAD